MQKWLKCNSEKSWNTMQLNCKHHIWSEVTAAGTVQRSRSRELLLFRCLGSVHFNSSLFTGGENKRAQNYILADSVWIYSTGPKTNSTNPSPTQFSTSVSSLNAFLQCSSVHMLHSLFFFYTRLHRWLMTFKFSSADLRGKDEMFVDIRGDTQPSSHNWEWNKLPQRAGFCRRHVKHITLLLPMTELYTVYPSNYDM